MHKTDDLARKLCLATRVNVARARGTGQHLEPGAVLGDDVHVGAETTDELLLPPAHGFDAHGRGGQFLQHPLHPSMNVRLIPQAVLLDAVALLPVRNLSKEHVSLLFKAQRPLRSKAARNRLMEQVVVGRTPRLIETQLAEEMLLPFSDGIEVVVGSLHEMAAM